MSQPIGFQKVAFAPRLTGTALGALAGAAAAPEDEGWTGAAMGGLAGYGAGALAGRASDAIKARWPRKPVDAPAGSPSSSASPGTVRSSINTAPPTPAPTPALPLRDRIQQALYQSELTPKVPNVMQTMSQAHPNSRAGRAYRNMVIEGQMRRPRYVKRASVVGFDKVADVGMTAGIPGLAVNLSGKDERLPGMSRWVPRATLQRAFEGVEQGYDPQALMEQAADRGSLAHPAVAAAISAALAHKLSPNAHWGLPALAAAAGGGAGALYNQMTAPKRVEDMRQAIRGVMQEQAHNTAQEAMPRVMPSSNVET